MIFDYFSSQLYKFSNNFRLAIRIKLPSFYGGGGGIRPLLEQSPPRVAACPRHAAKSPRVRIPSMIKKRHRGVQPGPRGVQIPKGVQSERLGRTDKLEVI